MRVPDQENVHWSSSIDADLPLAPAADSAIDQLEHLAKDFRHPISLELFVLVLTILEYVQQILRYVGRSVEWLGGLGKD